MVMGLSHLYLLSTGPSNKSALSFASNLSVHTEAHLHSLRVISSLSCHPTPPLATPPPLRSIPSRRSPALPLPALPPRPRHKAQHAAPQRALARLDDVAQPQQQVLGRAGLEGRPVHARDRQLARLDRPPQPAVLLRQILDGARRRRVVARHVPQPVDRLHDLPLRVARVRVHVVVALGGRARGWGCGAGGWVLWDGWRVWWHCGEA